MEKDNTAIVLGRFVTELAIPLTQQTLNDELQKHPDYNTLLAMSEVLDSWQIPNAAYQLSFDELLAAEIEGPFIALTSRKEFLLVNRLSEKQAIVSNEGWNKHRLPIESFKKIYSGSVLIAEKDDASGEAEYAIKHRKEVLNNMRIPVVIGGGALLLLVWLLFNSPYLTVFSWQIAALTLFKTAGLFTTILLLIQSIDTNNPLIQKLCGGDNNKSCNAILSSKAAKITDEVSWSELGFFYFAGSWLVLLFNSNNPPVIQILILLNIISLPYTFYSIYYQWRVAKQWCLLCCTVQTLLWMEFFAFLPLLRNGIEVPTISDWANLITGMAIPVLAWVLIKPYLLSFKQIKHLKSQLRQHKYNKTFFNHLLNDEVQYSLPDEDSSLIIGNREAKKVITVVSNPFCQPCAQAHKDIAWLNDRNDVKLQVIFTTDTETDPSAQVALHLLAIQKSRNDSSLRSAMDDWYGQKHKNYEAWAKIHPKTNDIVSGETLKKQREWCNLTQISVTPTFFLNGRRLPKSYQVDDLKYVI